MEHTMTLPAPASSGGRPADQAVGCLFMQLHVFTDCTDKGALAKAIQGSGLTATLYENLHDPRGVGVVFATTSPDELIDRAGDMLRSGPFTDCTPVPSYTMLGRTYLVGYERDVEEVLLRRPLERLLDPALRWAVWYPLRRSGSFEHVPADEQRRVLREHGTVGAEFSAGGQAYDIRLACHGLDANDNDFVIGILGPDLTRLSMLVERMRKTVQTSTYLEKLGPFFVGRAAFRTGS
jgi:chlorite dismutase